MGFNRTTKKCEPYQCDVGQHNCLKCPDQDKMDAHYQCAKCDDGFFVHKGSKLCTECRKTCESNRRENGGCDDGIHDTNCVPWDCLDNDEGTNCKKGFCVPQDARREQFQCLEDGCTSGHWRNSTLQCTAYECTDGENNCSLCADQDDRIVDGHCQRCDEGFFIDKDTFQCTKCNPCEPNRRRFGGCDRKIDTVCLPWDCFDDGFETNCKSGFCVLEDDRSAHNQCLEKGCNDGYWRNEDAQHKDFKKCFPFQCEENDETKCADCQKQKDRRFDNDCRTCYAGYYPDEQEQKCKPYECEQGKENCLNCPARGDMTAHHQCAKCDDGFFVHDDSKLCTECRKTCPLNRRIHGGCDDGIVDTNCVPWDCLD